MNDKVTAACSKKETTIRPSEMILEIGKTRDALIKVLCIDADNALEKAIKFVGDYYGFTMDYAPAVKKDIWDYAPAVKKDIWDYAFPRENYMTVAEIAQKFGLKTGKVNRLLVKLGLQYEDYEGAYRLTKEGKKHGFRNVDDEGVKEILWDEGVVIDILTDSFISD